uniref:Uncharacterized protein n=1 Tax=Caenorhabditis tropicalis TaxID=1561998 RepID=A0A1I7UXB1_9PELO
MPEEERKKTMEKIRNWMILMKNYLESDLEQLEKSRMRYERVEEPRDRVNVINPLKRGRPGYIVEEERCKEVKRMLRRMRAGELLPIEMVHHHYNLATLKGERLVEEINARKAQGIEEEIEEPEEWNVDDELEEYSVIGPRVEQEIDDFLMGHDHPSFLIPGAADFIFPKFCIEKIKRKWWRMKRDIEEWVEKFIEDEDNLQLIIEKQFNGQSLSEFLNNEGHGMPLGIFIQLKSNFNRVVNEFNGFKVMHFYV